MLKKCELAVLVLSVVWLISGCSSSTTPTQQETLAVQPPAPSESGSAVVSPTALAKTDTTPGNSQGEVLPQSPLQLIVDSPKEGDVISTSEVKVSGRTAPGAVVSVNDTFTIADEKGQFSLTPVFEPGLQLIEVEASNISGEDEVVTLSVDIQPE